MSALNLKQLSHVALNVSEIARSHTFYKDVLGLEILFETELPEGMGFTHGFISPTGVMIELIQIAGLTIEVPQPASTLAFSVADLEAAKATLQADGVEIKNEMEFSGIKMFFVSDPDGHNIEICQFPDGHLSAAELHGRK